MARLRLVLYALGVLYLACLYSQSAVAFLISLPVVVWRICC